MGVVGAGGRMGVEVCRAVREDPELELVAAVDPRLAGTEVHASEGGATLEIGGGLEALAERGAEVAVDFTVASSAVATMRWCAENSVHAVVGTTGIAPQTVRELEVAFSASTANCVIAPNFAIGAVLMMRFAELAAPVMSGAEIIELHHDAKRDAPSGTSLATASRMADARFAAGLDAWPEDRTSSQVIGGSRGAEGPGRTRIHAVRLPGLVAHQEVVLSAAGQALTIRHDAYDRSSFMPGVLLAVKAVGAMRGLTQGLEEILGI